MDRESQEGSSSCTFKKLVDLFKSQKSLYSKRRVGNSSSESSFDLPNWTEETKRDVDASSSLDDLKPHMFFIIDQIHRLECDVQRERQLLSKELEMIRTHKQFTSTKKYSSGFLSMGTPPTSGENTPKKQRYEHYKEIGLDETATGRTRSSTFSGEMTVRSKVAQNAEESPEKPPRRRRSALGIIDLDRIKSCLGVKSSVIPQIEEYYGDLRFKPFARRSSRSLPSLTERTISRIEPTNSEIQTWAESFDALLSSKRGRLLFQEFLRSEYSEENILFWIACEHLRQKPKSAAVAEEVKRIYEDFISSLSPTEVSLDFATKDDILQNMKEPSRYIFDDAQEHIYQLMRKDCFPRFVNSDMFRKESVA